MSIKRNATTKAFGVEQGWAPYRLRQARYYELGVDCAAWAMQQFWEQRRPLELLDIGTWDGVARKYIEVQSGGQYVNYHGVDVFPKGREFVYRHAEWTLHHIDLEGGLVGLASDAYDVVICEQVLEHLRKPHIALHEMQRVLRPGGRAIIGVPIFPAGLAWARKHLVPPMDRLLRVKKKRGHVQAWSHRSFLNCIRRNCPDLDIEKTRGFRIVSGGLLRPLEYQRWWWQLNRRLGALVPSLCIEVQVVARKRKDASSTSAALSRAA